VLPFFLSNRHYAEAMSTVSSSSADPSVVVLVTGATRGIGLSIAQLLAAKGCRIAVHGRNLPSAQEVASSKLSHSEGHHAFSADLSSPDACERLMAQVIERFGRLDVLINNAGVSIDRDGEYFDLPYENFVSDWQTTFDTNFHGAANLMFLASKQMLKQERRTTSFSDVEHKEKEVRGRIVNVSSRAAYAGDRTAPAYAASKVSLNVLSQSFARQLAPEGVFIFVVSPGATDTEMWGNLLTAEQRIRFDAAHPLRRIGRPVEVAQEVAWFALESPPLATGSVNDLNGAMYTH
jgi:3-oxoacyl-[acyl-carrier protein] reductase